jgi:putative ABC transport system permease protein
MLKEYFKIAIKNLKTRPLRSWLTILGIVIGVFLVTSLLSLSEGIKGAILKQLKTLGGEALLIHPGETTDIKNVFLGKVEFKKEEIEAIKRVEGVEKVMSLLWKGVNVRYEGEKKIVLLYGIFWQENLELLREKMGWSLKEGRWPIVGKNEVVVGNLVKEDIFPKIKTNTEIIIKGKKFKVVGILKSTGDKIDDGAIMVDLKFYREITGDKNWGPLAIAIVKAGFGPEEVAEKIKSQLKKMGKRKRGEERPSFSVITSEKASGIVGNIMAIMQFVVFSFSSIAILVGAIGIMNTMYTSVRERTREIGLLKAIGAKNSTISLIFLIESGLIGLVGGFLGTILGLALAKAIEIYLQFHPFFYLKAFISPLMIIFVLTFSFLIGCLSGFFPARQAAKLKPIQALRYE